MATVDGTTIFFFYAAALTGLSFGIFGNLFISSFFKVYDNMFENGILRIDIKKEIVLKKRDTDLLLLYMSMISLAFLTFYALHMFNKYAPK